MKAPGVEEIPRSTYDELRYEVEDLEDMSEILDRGGQLAGWRGDTFTRNIPRSRPPPKPAVPQLHVGGGQGKVGTAQVLLPTVYFQ